MGHLINPTAYRVGYFSNWTDMWMSTNNMIYSEMLHNSLLLRNVMAFFFENFITDKYSIFYSHFTVEEYCSTQFYSKFYFYDGIVEQKSEFISQFIRNYNKTKRRRFSFFLRRFKFVENRRRKINMLFWWRYYDYLLAKKTIFLFTFFFRLDVHGVSRGAFRKLKGFYFNNFEKKWFELLKKDPNLTVMNFIQQYIRYTRLSLPNFFKKEKEVLGDRHKIDFSLFFFVFKTIYLFWSKRQHFFRLLMSTKRILYTHRYKPYMSFLAKTEHIVAGVFGIFYRLYFIHFRQVYFFKFMHHLLNPLVERFTLLRNKLGFFGLDNDAVTSSFLSRYIARKLELRFRINELFGPITRDLRFIMKNKRLLRGYKLQFIGRITRRDRLRTAWAVGGSIPYSTMSGFVEHSYSYGILRNGVCSIRVWLYRHKSYGNYNYKYSYKLSENANLKHV